MSDGISSISLSAEQQQRMLVRLRFGRELESAFRREHEAGAPVSRMTLQAFAALLIALTPLYDVSLLHAPPGFLNVARMLQFGVEIPFALLSLLVTAWKPLRRFSAATTTLAAVVIATCLVAQRIIGEAYHFVVPHEFPALALSAVLFLGRLRLFSFLPWAGLAMVGTTIAELSVFHDSAAWYGAISAWMLFTISVLGAYALEYSTRKSWYLGQLLQFQASRDALTGLPNRRHFDLQLRALVRDAARQRKNVALLIIDIDHFKAFNDHYGHPRGDECLRRIGARLALAMRRPHDFCARIGGEEFAAVWFDSLPGDAIRLAEQLRLAISELGIPAAPGHGESVTASAGLAQAIAPSPADTAERICADLMKAADAALYEAKRAGRARLMLAGSALAARPAAGAI